MAYVKGCPACVSPYGPECSQSNAVFGNTGQKRLLFILAGFAFPTGNPGSAHEKFDDSVESVSHILIINQFRKLERTFASIVATEFHSISWTVTFLRSDRDQRDKFSFAFTHCK